MGMWFYAVLAFLGGASFGILSTFVKLAYGEGFEPGQVIGAQFFTGALLFWIVFFMLKKQKVAGSMIFKLMISGIPMALSGLFYYQSLQYLDASIAIIMLFQFSWMGILAEAILDKKKPTRSKVISAIILFFGSLLGANVFSASLEQLTPIGVGWGLLAAVSFTGFILVSGRVGTEVAPITKSMYMATGALIVAFIVYRPTFLIDGSYFTSNLLYYGLFLGFFGVVLPPLLFSISMPRVGSGLGTILSSSELPTAVIMSMLVLKETVYMIQWIGVLVVLLGISLPSIRDALRKKKEKDIVL